MLQISFGAYSGTVEVDDSMVNKGKGVPLALLAGRADRLSVDKVKFKFHKETSKDCDIQPKFSCKGSFSASGEMTVKGDDPCVDMMSDPDATFWLDVAVEGRGGMLAVDIPAGALDEKKPNVFTVKNHELTGEAGSDKPPTLNAKFDFNKRTFTVAIKRLCLDAMDMEPGEILEVDLGFERMGEDFEQTDTFAYAGRSIVAADYAFTDCDDGMPTIPRGTAVVDGDLDEWAGAEWTYLDAVYYSEPSDVSEARFTARWDESTSTIYVAVVVTDNDDHRTDGFAGSWDAGDRIEILSVGDAEVATDWESDHDVGQEYVLGVTMTGGYWAAWGTGENLDVYSPDPCLIYAARMVDNQYIYEAQVKQYDNYGAFPSATGPTVVTALSVGHVVRFDVIANTRHSAGFGMKAVDSNVGRFRDSGLITEFVLVE